jgi:sugar phosphate isomerase/epimerase
VALGGVPLFDAAGADAAGIEGMPLVAAETAPQFVARGFPIAERAADARTGEAGTDAGFFVCDDLAHDDLDSENRRKVSGIVTGMPRKMTMCLTPGSIGVKANQMETIQYAHHYGYEAVQPYGEELATMSAAQVEECNGRRKEYRLQWGQGGMGVDFRKDEETFRKDLAGLPAIAAALQKAGATRLGTWISPQHDTLTYSANMKQHARRLKEVMRVLGDHGLRLGLEYVGPKTLWSAKRFPFVHTMAEMKDLLGEIGAPNAGFVLDTWHWYTAGETAADLATLKNSDVVCIDLNDAPAGMAVDQQIDSKREIPMATGVIDTGAFLNALAGIGCDAPVRCEPFNAALRAKPKEEILATVAESMKKAFSLLKS